MARATIRHLVLGVAAAGVLSGCVAGEGPFAADSGASEDAASPAVRTTAGKPRDVEAPEVFQVSETALWDGRPSLGGVWVASPDTTDPERVIMRNPANGKSVVGALFRRERDNPGPKLQISSDAAEALGLLAGQPAEISVTAMRREEVAEEPAVVAAAPVAEAEASEAPDAAPAPAGEAGNEATAVAAAALAAVDAEPAAETDTGTGTDTETGTDAEAAIAAAPEAGVAAAPEAPKKLTWRERRAEARAKRQAERAAKAAAAAGTAVAGAAVAGEEAVSTAAIVAEVETAPLDARSPEAMAAPAPEPAAAPQPAATAATGPGRPIQIGFFSQESNAERAVAELSRAGVPASARREESNGKAYWSVTSRGDAAVLAKAKAAGFADAYFLK